MYKLDGKLDEIRMNIAESENTINEYNEAKQNMHEQKLKLLFKNFTSRETQMKIQLFVLNPNVIEELALIFIFVDKHIDKERQSGEKGLATHLLAILLGNLSQCNFFKKLIMIIGCPQLRETLESFNMILGQRCILIKLLEIIEDYLKSLCQLEDRFYIDVENVTDIKKLNLFSEIKVTDIILIIHHLLNHPKTSNFATNKIFNIFELSPDFMSFLKLSLRNLSL